MAAVSQDLSSQGWRGMPSASCVKGLPGGGGPKAWVGEKVEGWKGRPGHGLKGQRVPQKVQESPQDPQFHSPAQTRECLWHNVARMRKQHNQVDKRAVVRPRAGILFSQEKHAVRMQATTRVNPENSTGSERGQTQQTTRWMIP